MKFMALWFFVWPMAAVGIVMAMFRGQTFTEFLDERNKQAEARKAQAQKVVEDARKAVAACPVHWHEVDTTDMKILLLVRDMAGVQMPTHMVCIPKESDKHIVCIHAMPKPSDSTPFRFLDNQATNLSDAMKLCIEDVDWAYLCVPGLESARWIAWQREVTMIRRRKREVGL